jgi:membrane protease YdiL (CAAX protease family)
MVLPSILFGVSHYNPDIPVEATTLHCIWAIFFGLAAADLTARTGTLGAAIGLHFAYNLPLIILYAEPGLMSGFGLFVQPTSWADSDPTLISFAFDLFYLWMVWMTCRIGIRC